MRLLLFLVPVSIHLSKAFSLPFNSSVLPLPSQDTTHTQGGTHIILPLQSVPWPVPPFQRYIRNGLSLEINAFGDSLSGAHTDDILLGILSVKRAVLHAGNPNDVLDEIVTIADTMGDVYTNIGFYALPPLGITVSQAAGVLDMASQLMTAYFPPKELTSAAVVFQKRNIALFRLSFRVS